jgi:phosphohistidine phosphatase
VHLILVRHAKAAPGEPDELRPLTPEGRMQASELGTRLRAQGVQPDAVLTSPLVRARETAAALGLGDAEVDERLAPGASPEEIREAATGRGDTVVVVGHQPDCGQAVLAFAGVEVQFPPAGHHELQL